MEYITTIAANGPMPLILMLDHHWMSTQTGTSVGPRRCQKTKKRPFEKRRRRKVESDTSRAASVLGGVQETTLIFLSYRFVSIFCLLLIVCLDSVSSTSPTGCTGIWQN